ncbi:carbohydrate porin [Zoogloea sp.]|uniref:carbohydrate porin n=1 Tax=Zoogloea sp. TaxID=49181 RepID=UPI002590750E|nr:carbohydrate porin [Zoogloea sp.]MDD2667485.1 carbohydrate porin [Zoogloea sp.]
MKHHLPGALCVALAVAFPGAAFAATPAAPAADLKQLREQLRELRESYEQRIQALEKRLADTEQQATRAVSSAAAAGTTASAAVQSVVKAEARAAEAQATADSVASRPTSASAFNPAVSLIIDSKFTRLQRDPSAYRIDGFMPSGGEVGPPRKGFSLGESELAFSANVDHLFRGNARFALAEDDGAGVVEVEEVNVETLAMPAGLKLKAGRFLSGVGYINQQHPHEWDFSDAPLAYKAFFGYRLQNDGVQVRWVAPTELFMEFGAEVAGGDKYPGAERKANGAGLWTAFAHVGGDIGDSSAWQLGLSHVRANPRERGFEDNGVSNAFSGRSQTWIADFVYKWAPNGNSRERYLKVQGEYLQRRESGELSYNLDADGVAEAASAARFRQSGSYLQAVYQFMPHWRLGVRGDWLRSGTADLGTLDPTGLPILAAYNPARQTAMVDWSPSEFSRLRLQLARDKSRNGESDNQVWLQYIMSLGAHGAHKF